MQCRSDAVASKTVIVSIPARHSSANDIAWQNEAHYSRMVVAELTPTEIRP
jgi:hypothetical protein